MRISRTTLVGLLTVSGVGRHGGGEVTILCTVEGGVACRLEGGAWDDAAIAVIAPRLIEEIGWKTIEHAADRRVRITCTAAGAAGGAECRIDLGDGFKDLPVRDTDDA